MKLFQYAATYHFLIVVAGLAAHSLTSADARATEPTTPWRLDTALATPAWLTLSGEHRSRLEILDGQFRQAGSGGDQALVFRTLLRAGLDFDRLGLFAEMQDSRATLVDVGSPLSTTVVNPLELLQAHIRLRAPDLFLAGSATELRAGRLTMDLGKRRLVARNRFRNTINNFTGVDVEWTGPGRTRLRAFFVLPVERRVGETLLDAGAAFDSEDDEVSFAGLYGGRTGLPAGGEAELYLLYLDEADSADRPTRNRRLWTAGGRLWRRARAGHVDYEAEAIYQWGTSRTDTTTTRDLDHRAWFMHLEFGYTFDAPLRPRLLAQFDHASGDDDPGDASNNRFDTLFGARRFDFGPTGQLGAFARANITTPGLRLQLQPSARTDAFVAVRGFWLADSDDAWTTAGIRNPPGRDDRFVGALAELRLGFDILPGNLRLEAGAAWLSAGALMDNAGKGDTRYLYSQVVVWF